MEIWKVIEEYPNYMVSSIGRVKSLNYNRTGKEKILKPYKNPDGYLQVILSKDGKIKSCKTHRLVAQAFIPNTDNKPCIDHINTNRTDNRVENLRWVTHTENMNNLLTLNKLKGENNYKAKSIIQFSKDGDFIKKWDCQADIERELNILKSSISNCCSGRSKTSGGYKWGYEEDYEKIPFKVFDLKIYKKVS